MKNARERWRFLYRQVRLGRKDVMPTSFIEVDGVSIEIYFQPKSVEVGGRRRSRRHR